MKDVFAAKARAAMAVSRHTLRTIAQECGCSPQAVKKWTDGAAMPSSAKLMAFCRATGCSVDWLLSPEPIDMKSAPYAPEGRHIKEWIRECLREM